MKVALDYTGYQTTSLATAMRSCQISDAPLMMHVVKMYNNPEGDKFFSLARIYSGSVKGTAHEIIRSLRLRCALFLSAFLLTVCFLQWDSR